MRNICLPAAVVPVFLALAGIADGYERPAATQASPAERSGASPSRFVVTGLRCDGVFLAVGGLDVDAPPAAYGTRAAPAPTPRAHRSGHVTLKKGILTGRNTAAACTADIAVNRIRRSTVVVTLVDATGRALMTWKLGSAFPIKLEASDGGKDRPTLVETMELAYATITATPLVPSP